MDNLLKRSWILIPVLLCVFFEIAFYQPEHYSIGNRLIEKMDPFLTCLLFMLFVYTDSVKRKQASLLKQIIQSSFYVYIFFVLKLTIFPIPSTIFLGFVNPMENISERIMWMQEMIAKGTWFNFIPFKTIATDIVGHKSQLAGNLIMLLPLGIYLPLLHPQVKNFRKILLRVFYFTAII